MSHVEGPLLASTAPKAEAGCSPPEHNTNRTSTVMGLGGKNTNSTALLIESSILDPRSIIRKTILLYPHYLQLHGVTRVVTLLCEEPQPSCTWTTSLLLGAVYQAIVLLSAKSKILFSLICKKLLTKWITRRILKPMKPLLAGPVPPNYHGLVGRCEENPCKDTLSLPPSPKDMTRDALARTQNKRYPKRLKVFLKSKFLMVSEIVLWNFPDQYFFIFPKGYETECSPLEHRKYCLILLRLYTL